MPPRLNLLRPQTNHGTASCTIPSLFTPFLLLRPQPLPPPTHRAASILASLSDTPGSYSKRIRRGRGASSGKGKTSGRGHKGQKQHGKVPFSQAMGRFQGGQTPIPIVKGKRGFDNQFSVEMSTVNLDRVQSWIDQGRLDASKPITVKELKATRCIGRVRDGIKLLAKNAETVHTPIHITVSRASAAAIAAIEAAGGSVQTRYYTHASLSRILRGETHPTLSLLSQPSSSIASFPPPFPFSPLNTSTTTTPTAATISPSTSSATQLGKTETKAFRYRLPDPASRKDLEYYRDPAHRGYLSHQVAAGQGPSLFFKTPREVATGVGGVGGVKRRKGGAAAGKKGENSLW